MSIYLSLEGVSRLGNLSFETNLENSCMQDFLLKNAIFGYLTINASVIEMTEYEYSMVQLRATVAA